VSCFQESQLFNAFAKDEKCFEVSSDVLQTSTLMHLRYTVSLSGRSLQHMACTDVNTEQAITWKAKISATIGITCAVVRRLNMSGRRGTATSTMVSSKSNTAYDVRRADFVMQDKIYAGKQRYIPRCLPQNIGRTE